MAGRTSNYGLNKFGGGDSISVDGYKFGMADRDTIDAVLWRHETHHHDALTVETPAEAPTVEQSAELGTLAAATRYYYKYSIVDGDGRESEASEQAYADTPAQVVAPGAPGLQTDSSSGVLPAGNYLYVLTAYNYDSDRTETKALNAAQITVGAATPGSINTVTLTLPTLPAGAQGFNIYRRGPGEVRYMWLAAVAMDVATPPTSYVDDGTIAEDCNRTLPLTNRTATSASLEISLPTELPGLGANYTWKIFRSTVSGDFGPNSLLHWVQEADAEGSEYAVTSYVDKGYSTTNGGPQVAGAGALSKVLLTDGAEVQGQLPSSMVAGFPVEVTFTYADTLVAQSGVFLWNCPYNQARIVSVRATLGAESWPAATPVLVGINRWTGQATPTPVDLTFEAQPTIEVGLQYSDLWYPPAGEDELTIGDMLSVDIIQAGGGATPTDRNLTVQIYMMAMLT